MRAERAGILIAITLAATACRGDYDAPQESAAAIPPDQFCATVLPRVDSFVTAMERERPVTDSAKYGGTVVVGEIGDMPDGVNHFVSSNYDSAEHEKFVNLMTLVQYAPDLSLTPYLAESWEIDDPEKPSTITFHLRSDVFWHDGVKTTAEDVAFTYVVATDTLTAYPNAAKWDKYVRGPSGVEVVDSFTVRVHLTPHADYMDVWPSFPIMPKHLLEGVPVTELKQHPFGAQCPVGNGPFVFVEHRPQESWTFRANPAFPAGLGGRPFLDRYVYRVVPEQTTLLTDLLTENIDVYINPRPDQAPQILANESLTLLHGPFRSYNLVAWNARRPQLADARVRRALTLGLDRGQIVKSQLRGYGVVANTGLPTYHYAYDTSLNDSLKFDPAGAKRLLEEAGWTDRNGDGVRENADGQPLEFTVLYNQGNQQRQDIAEIMQAQLGQIGVRVKPQVMEFGTMIATVTAKAREFDAVIFGWVVDFSVDETDFFHSKNVDAPYAMTGTRNPRLDQLLDTLKVTADREAARPLWREYQLEILKEQPYTYLYFPERLDGYNNRVQGLVMDKRGEWRNIKDWWIPRDQRRDAERPAAR